MRLVLIGDSHLARLTGRHRAALERALPGWAVANHAVGGATVRDLDAQLSRVGLRGADILVLSVGTNDAAPDRQVPPDEFRARLVQARRRFPGRVLLLDPPGVVEGPSTRDRTNAAIDLYRAVLLSVFPAPPAAVISVRDLVDRETGLGLVADGMHLSGASYGVLVSRIVQELV